MTTDARAKGPTSTVYTGRDTVPHTNPTVGRKKVPQQASAAARVTCLSAPSGPSPARTARTE
jgi:hypothetical protein